MSDLCAAFDVTLTVDPKMHLDESAALTDGRVLRAIRIRPIVDDITYSTALHEIGHCLHALGTAHRSARDAGAYENLQLDAEEAAWDWARHYALEWTDVMERDARLALESYRRAAVFNVRAYNSRPGSRVILCPKCRRNNRLKPATRQRCGACQYEFTPLDVQQAVLGDKIGLPKVPKEPTLPRVADERDEDEDEENTDD